MSDRTAPPRPARLRRWEWLLIEVLLLGSFALRVARFTQVPPGIIHDEVRNWFNAQMVLAGDIRALYPHGGGREALFMFLEAASYQLVGSNVVAARLPSLAFSMLGVAISFCLARRLFGSVAGLVAAAGLATSFWSLMFARLAVRTGSMPVMAMIAAYLFLQLVQAPAGGARPSILAGLTLGATLYTYPTALFFPPVLIAWLLAIAWLQPAWLRRKWQYVGTSLLLAAIMSIPLLRAWMDPANTARANEVNAPLEALAEGDPGPMLANVLPVLGVFSVQGDHGLEFNIQDQPIFPTLPMAVLFYSGLILSVWGLARQDSRHRAGCALVLLWVVGMLAPTLVTERPVNPSRTIGLLGVVYMVPAIAAAEGLHWARLWGRDRLAWGIVLIVALALAHQLQHTVEKYFIAWAENPVVRFLYQSEYRALADFLDTHPEPTPLALGGLTPHEMDAASMRLLMRNDDYLEVMGFFDPQTSLLVPYSESRETRAYVVVPSSITIHPALAGRFAAWGIQRESAADPFTIYVTHSDAVIPSVPTNGQRSEFYWSDNLGPELLIDFLGFEWVGSISPGQLFTLLTYWEVRRSAEVPLRIFVHVVDREGTILAQSDLLGVPSTQWRSGDQFVQAHDLALPSDMPTGPYRVRLGLYDPLTGLRLRVSSPPDYDYLEVELP